MIAGICADFFIELALFFFLNEITKKCFEECFFAEMHAFSNELLFFLLDHLVIGVD